MPRPLRIEFEGAWYHVMNRGLNFQNIFHIYGHRYLFFKLLEDISNKFLVEIHGFCLMDNHYHLLIHTPLANLGKAMRHLDGVYTQRFNRLEKRDGPLFRGRYKAILIEKDAYLLQVSRYIHLNPISAKICTHPEQYLWSSYQYYISKRKKLSWLHTQVILNLINEKNRQESYINFIDNGIDSELKLFYKKTHTSPILGRQEFIDKHIKKLDSKYKIEVITDIRKTKSLIDPKIIFSVVEKYYHTNLEVLKASTPGKKNNPRIALIYLLRTLAHCSNKKISEYLTNIKFKGISTILARCDLLLMEDESFQMDVKNLKDLIFQIYALNLEDVVS